MATIRSLDHAKCALLPSLLRHPSCPAVAVLLLIELKPVLTSLIILPRRSETELSINIKKATSPEETAPKRKHVRSCIVYTWDHKSGQSFWAGLKVCV